MTPEYLQQRIEAVKDRKTRLRQELDSAEVELKDLLKELLAEEYPYLHARLEENRRNAKEINAAYHEAHAAVLAHGEKSRELAVEISNRNPVFAGMSYLLIP